MHAPSAPSRLVNSESHITKKVQFTVHACIPNKKKLKYPSQPGLHPYNNSNNCMQTMKTISIYIYEEICSTFLSQFAEHAELKCFSPNTLVTFIFPYFKLHTHLLFCL